MLEDSGHLVVSIFLSASSDYRLNQAMERTGLPEKKAAALMKKTDKQRREYYEYHTGKDWGAASSYDVCLNVESMGLSNACTLLVEAYGKLSAI